MSGSQLASKRSRRPKIRTPREKAAGVVRVRAYTRRVGRRKR